MPNQVVNYQPFGVRPLSAHLALVEYFVGGNRSAYLRATLKIMKSIMIADQLREAQAYGQQKTAELGIEPIDVSAQVQTFLKGSPGSAK